jgi:hypothetical protein
LAVDWLGRHLAVSAGRARRDGHPVIFHAQGRYHSTAFLLARSSLRRHAVVYQKPGTRRDCLRNGVACSGTLASKEGTDPPSPNPTSHFHLRPPSRSHH